MLRISISDQFSGASMSRASRQQRTMTGRLLGLEWLEPRRLLSLWAPRYSGPQKVDHSGYLHLLRLFPSQPP